jgi:hypothetical protein
MVPRSSSSSAENRRIFTSAPVFNQKRSLLNIECNWTLDERKTQYRNGFRVFDY